VMLFYGVVEAGVTTYELLPGSSFEEGCVSPCMCPVAMHDDLVGTFALAKKRKSGQDNFYQIKDISWKVADSYGETVHAITGAGIYHYQNVGNHNVKHQLTLDVKIDGGKPINLDSGYTLGCSEFPAVAVSVRRGTQCFDIWMDIIAASINQPK